MNIWVARLLGTHFPYAHASIINIVGSLVDGPGRRLVRRARRRRRATLRLFLATGILGGFTTFSAFSLDAVLLWERHEHLLAAPLCRRLGGGRDRGPGAGPLDHEDDAGVSRPRLRRHRRRRRRRRPDVRHPRRPARPAGAAAGSRRQGRQEDPDLGRRALQFHQPACAGPRLSCRPTRISASRRWRATRSTISSPWSSKHRIAWHEKTLGQLFCDGSARADRGHAAGRMRARPASTSRVGASHHRHRRRPTASRVSTDHGDFTAAALVLATGGLSIPKMGATGFAHDVARRFGLARHRDAAGAGAAHRSKVPELEPACRSTSWRACGRTSFREAMLFTHRGLSGPAILQISSYWRAGQEIVDRPAARRTMRRRSSRSASARGPRPSCAPCWAKCCRSGWR